MRVRNKRLEEYIELFGEDYCLWKVVATEKGITPATMKDYCPICKGYDIDFSCNMKISLNEVYTSKYNGGKK